MGHRRKDSPSSSPQQEAKMAEAACVVRSFRVGKRTCTTTIQAPRPGNPAHATAEWEPNLPDRAFTKKELRQYRAGRDAIMAELGALLSGGGTLVIET